MKLNDIFNITRGVRLTKANQQPGNIPLVTAGNINDGIKGKINNGLSALYSHVITIDMFGFVKFRPYQFYCDDNIIVLSPKDDYEDTELIYYSLVLAKQTEGKYDYGRQCRLKNIDFLEIPSRSEIPAWIYEMEMPNYSDIIDSKMTEHIKLPPVTEWGKFTYTELFIMSRGSGGTITSAKRIDGTNEFITASAENNGLSLYTGKPTTEKANTITVANDGSVGEAFYHSRAYLANSAVTVLELKNHTLTPAIAMFLITLIKKEQFKFNYGRKWGLARMANSIIKLPVKEDQTPDWELMENYINSLPYSKYL